MAQGRTENQSRNRHPYQGQKFAYSQWLLERILHVHPGDDGVVRAATIKTATGEIKRAAKHLCPLPVNR